MIRALIGTLVAALVVASCTAPPTFHQAVRIVQAEGWDVVQGTLCEGMTYGRECLAEGGRRWAPRADGKCYTVDAPPRTGGTPE